MNKRLIALAMLLLVGETALIFGGSYLFSDLSDCSGTERAIVEEYPHYGDRHIATYPWTFSCSVRYTTRADRREVLGYYDEMLRRNGWEVTGFQTTAEGLYPANPSRSCGISQSRGAASSLPAGTGTATRQAIKPRTERTLTSLTRKLL